MIYNIYLKIFVVIFLIICFFILPEDLINSDAFIPALLIIGLFGFSAYYFIKTNLFDKKEQNDDDIKMNENVKSEYESRNKKIQESSPFFYSHFIAGPLFAGVVIGIILFVYSPKHNTFLLIFSSLIGLLVGAYWMYYVYKGKGNSNNYLPLEQSEDITRIFDERKWKDKSANDKK